MLPGERCYFATDQQDIEAMSMPAFVEYEVVTEDGTSVFFSERGCVAGAILYCHSNAPCLVKKWWYPALGPPKLQGQIGYNGNPLCELNPLYVKACVNDLNRAFVAKLYKTSDDYVDMILTRANKLVEQ